jgi:uncharacterized protein YeaO (DUF488 family)
VTCEELDDGGQTTDQGPSDLRRADTSRRHQGPRGPGLAARSEQDEARIDEWCKQVAPSAELHRWYAHDPGRFAEFARRYHAELDDPERAKAVTHLRELAQDRPLTLLTATKHSDISQAAVLAELLRAER